MHPYLVVIDKEASGVCVVCSSAQRCHSCLAALSVCQISSKLRWCVVVRSRRQSVLKSLQKRIVCRAFVNVGVRIPLNVVGSA
jgi:hypothetical protein